MARVLIAEYDREIRTLVVRVVRRLGHEPQIYNRPARDTAPEAALLIVDPAVDAGAEAERWFRARDPRAPVIATSIAPAEPGDGRQFVRWLEKPFALDELAQAIRHAVGDNS